MYHKYHSKNRNDFLGRTDKMDKMLNMKNQEYFQIILEKKSKEIKRRENSINSIRKSSLYVIIAHLKFASHFLHSGKQFTKRRKKKEDKQPKLY